jgi:hypothetical protein
MATINVTELTQTCGACPTQWEGRTADDHYIYVRFRWGALRIGIGATDAAAVDNAMGNQPAFFRQLGGSLDGFLDYDTLCIVTRGVVDWP